MVIVVKCILVILEKYVDALLLQGCLAWPFACDLQMTDGNREMLS
jgi:hypothetical protein